jgi:hypothetical protein
MKRLAIVLIAGGAGVLVYSLRYFFPASQSHPSLESISLDYFEARIETAIGGIMLIAGLYLYKTHQ